MKRMLITRRAFVASCSAWLADWASASQAASAFPATRATPALPAAPAELDAATRLCWLARVTWGANDSSAEQLARQGLSAWLHAQLHPAPAALPAAAQAQIDAMMISRTPAAALAIALGEQRRAAAALADDAGKRPGCARTARSWRGCCARRSSASCCARSIRRTSYTSK